jgi:uncharacterized protein YegJ (DUF2314 family)
MAIYKRGDFVKAGFLADSMAPLERPVFETTIGNAEWMWIKVVDCDDEKRIAYGRLDNNPIINRHLKAGAPLAVNYDDIVSHMTTDELLRAQAKLAAKKGE